MKPDLTTLNGLVSTHERLTEMLQKLGPGPVAMAGKPDDVSRNDTLRSLEHYRGKIVEELLSSSIRAAKLAEQERFNTDRKRWLQSLARSKSSPEVLRAAARDALQKLLA